MASTQAAGLIVLCQVPRECDTLVSRLPATGERLLHAIEDVRAPPPDDHLPKDLLFELTATRLTEVDPMAELNRFISEVLAKLDEVKELRDRFHQYVYGYDEDGRLTGVWLDPEDPTAPTLIFRANHYEYDGNGNRTSVTNQSGGLTVGQYDDQDRMTGYGAATYSYLDSGELFQKLDATGTTTYEYDPPWESAFGATTGE